MVEGEATSVSTFVPTIPTRPPTPPRRDANHIEVNPSALQRYAGKSKATSWRESNISVTTHESPTESPNVDTSSLRKKVEWADLSGLLESPGVLFDEPQGYQETQRPISASAKPTKSILKAQSQNAPDFEYSASALPNAKLLPPHHHATFSTMLDSITQQLAGTDRNSRLDAYLMLSSSLKASDNVPDLRALKDKLELLLSLIKRDLMEKTDTGRPDSSLVINALILLSTFLHKPAIAESITTDFAVYVADYAIKTFEDGLASKDIVKHLMFILAQQNFNPKIMNRERIGKLVKALHQIEPNNMKGKSIVIGRLNIYRNLLRQSRSHMLTHLDWTEDLFIDMISYIREIRTHAIEFGLEAAFSLGAEAAAARYVSSLFNLEVEGHGKYGDRYARRLKDMVKTKQDPMAPSSVPQIWSVVILFFRARPHQLEQWSFLASFIVVMESCFNCSDSAARKEALLAWNRLVSMINLDEKTSPTFVQLLSLPLTKQIQRGNLRASTLSTLYCLLYYAFKPSATHAQLDFYWKQYVVPIVGNCLISANAKEKPESARQGLVESCILLQSLFDSSNPRKWKESRAMENLHQNNFTAKELPALDPKWLRKCPNGIFQVLQPLLERLYWDLCDESDIALLWWTYVRSIALSAAMEVKVSNDTMATIATIFGFLYRIWHLGPEALQTLISNDKGNCDSSAFLKCFEYLIMTLLQELGPLPFVERQLCIGTQDTFVPIATPSQHPKKYRGTIRTPLQHLVTLFASVSPGIEYDSNYTRLVHRTFLPFFESRKARHGSVELAKTLTECLPSEVADSSIMIWQVSANFATAAVDTLGPEKKTSTEQPLGVVYGDLIKILEIGMDLAPFEPVSGWKVLFDAIIRSATSEVGEAGRAIAVIEPLAKAYLSDLSRTKDIPSLSYAQLLIENVSYPRERLALDSAHKLLWGIASAGPKALFDPYVHFYQFMQLSLESAYQSVSKRTISTCSDIVSATSTMLRRCPFPLILGVLSKLQRGVGLWIMDEEVKTGGGTVLTHSTVSLWAIICDIITRLLSYHDHNKILSEVETLLCSGLQSKNKITVNTTIRLWNSSFGLSKQQLAYPKHLKHALFSLRSVTEILVPSTTSDDDMDKSRDQALPIDSGQTQSYGDKGLDPPDFGSNLRAFRIDSLLESSPMQRLHQTTPQVILSSKPLKRSRARTPDSRPRKSRSRDITPSIRHNDSQVHFEAVNSSPVAAEASRPEILTDRQKEVKERQQAEAAMFPDLRSSPMSRTDSVEAAIQIELELPAYRSTSKLRKNITIGRQTTPTLVALSDEEQFVTSSPTPTRSLREETELVDAPPSSPPDALAEDKDVNEIEEDVISPLEVPTDQPSNDLALSRNPSTPICSAPPHQKVEISTYGSAFDSTTIFTTHDKFQSRIASVEHQPKPENAVVLANEPPILAMPLESESVPPECGGDDDLLQSQIMEDLPKAELQLPQTPKISRQEASALSGTPITPQQAFVDAPASPISSDLRTIDEEIFEDAVSSPRLEPKTARVKTDSSLLDDMNDSSLMRVMTDFENQADQSPRRISPVEEKENLPRRLRASSRNCSPKTQTKRATPLPNRKAALRRILLLRQEQTPDSEHDTEIAAGEKINPTSSIPSLIPETPATSVQKMQDKIIVEGEEYDPDDTIVVDDSALWNQEESPKTKRSKSGRSLAYPRKRKVGRMAESQDEVLDGQIAFTPDVSLLRPAAKRKRSDRSLRSSQASQEMDARIDLESSRSALSTYLAVSAPVEEEDHGADTFQLTVKDFEHATALETELETSEQNKVQPESIQSEDYIGTVNANEFNINGEGRDALAIDAQLQVETTSFEGLAESTIEPTSSLPVASNECAELNGEEIMQGYVESNTQPAEALTLPLVDAVSRTSVSPSAGVESPSDAESPVIAGMKEKLQKLIVELRSASLGRKEVNELEDLFMDAKGLLYDAGKRGRLSIDR